MAEEKQTGLGDEFFGTPMGGAKPPKSGGDLFIVDNSDQDWKVLQYLREWTDIAHRFDVATAYFEIGALLALDGQWQKLDNLRILMGPEVSTRTKKALLDGVKAIEQALDTSIEREKEANDFLSGVPAIVDALCRRQIECRVYTKRKFHAKTYITHSKRTVIGASALVGSSNLTYPGLTENVELNVQIRREVELLQEWYERYWDEAEDITPEILNFGSRWYDQNREIFYSPDPILVDDPLAVIDDPGLRSAYSYAGSSPLTFIDPTGLARTRTQELRLTAEKFALAVIGDDKPNQAAAVAKSIEAHLPRLLVKALGPAGLLVKWFDARPLLEIDLTGDKVKTQWSLGTRFADELVSKLFRRKDAESTSDDATGPGGGANVGNQAQPQTGGTGAQAPNPPRSDEPSTRGSASPPRPNKPLPTPPVASGDDGGARGDQ